jgi:hypothetical protein
MSIRLSDSETLLMKALDDLDKKWHSTAGGWNDKARDGFNKEHLEPLRHSVMNAQRGMRNVTELLRKVVKDCSEER